MLFPGIPEEMSAQYVNDFAGLEMLEMSYYSYVPTSELWIFLIDMISVEVDDFRTDELKGFLSESNSYPIDFIPSLVENDLIAHVFELILVKVVVIIDLLQKKDVCVQLLDFFNDYLGSVCKTQLNRVNI